IFLMARQSSYSPWTASGWQRREGAATSSGPIGMLPAHGRRFFFAGQTTARFSSGRAAGTFGAWMLRVARCLQT
ncbi:unnamed protein product, partial [Closterium sp. NIES-54]